TPSPTERGRLFAVWILQPERSPHPNSLPVRKSSPRRGTFNPRNLRPFSMREHPMTDILLIEDAPDLAAVIVRELEAVGFRVSHAADGETGLRLARQADYSLILLDWMLPKMDGLDVLRKLREDSPIPV